MRISAECEVVPWEFDAGEIEHLRSIFESGLVRAYLQSLQHMALMGKLVDPSNTLADVKAANDYMAGQEYILSAMLSSPLYVTPQKESNNV